MKIETKFSIGDKLYFIYNKGISCGKIIEVLASHRISDEFGNRETKIDYIIETGYIRDKVSEKYLFRTKQELLDSL